jgi:multidrug efflux system membrane fusion protein
MKLNRINDMIIVLIVGLVASFCFGCSSSKGNNQPARDQAIPVTVMQVVSRNVPLQVQAIGTMEAYSTVSIKSMVSGEVIKVHFTEGQKVTKGSLLFEIDRRPFEANLQSSEANLARDNAALMEAKANLAKDSAQAENASIQKNRYDLLVEKGVATKEQADQMKTNAAAAAAAVNADRAAINSANEAIRADHAAIEQAKIQLGYCDIYSPIDGRAGALMVDQGNIIKANDAAMVVINQVQPIYADFAVPEQYLPEIRRYMSGGKLKVAVIPQNEGPSEGFLTFVDNAVDSATGTIKLKATFRNTNERLWPGQFVSVVVTLSSQPHAIVVPNEAIQSGQEGPFVYVVKPDLTVESRPIRQGRVVGNETVIESGLTPGERVVTDGQLRLVPGARIQVKKPLEIDQENP